MHFKRHFQNAYVTHDIEAAKEFTTKQYGVTDYICFDPDTVVKTPQGQIPQRVRVVLAWIGNFQIELIQPISGFVDVFKDYLPPNKSDPGLRFHHICMRRDDLDAMHAEVDAMGLPRVFENEYPGGYYIYVDARKTLGHYIEYNCATEEGWKMMGWPESLP